MRRLLRVLIAVLLAVLPFVVAEPVQAANLGVQYVIPPSGSHRSNASQALQMNSRTYFAVQGSCALTVQIGNLPGTQGYLQFWPNSGCRIIEGSVTLLYQGHLASMPANGLQCTWSPYTGGPAGCLLMPDGSILVALGYNQTPFVGARVYLCDFNQSPYDGCVYVDLTYS